MILNNCVCMYRVDMCKYASSRQDCGGRSRHKVSFSVLHNFSFSWNCYFGQAGQSMNPRSCLSTKLLPSNAGVTEMCIKPSFYLNAKGSELQSLCLYPTESSPQLKQQVGFFYLFSFIANIDYYKFPRLGFRRPWGKKGKVQEEEKLPWIRSQGDLDSFEEYQLIYFYRMSYSFSSGQTEMISLEQEEHRDEGSS